MGLQRTWQFSTIITKIISCFNFNYSRYLKDQKEENEEKEDTRTRTDNFSIAIDHNKIKRSKRIFIGSKDESENMNNKIELFNDTEKRIPFKTLIKLTLVNKK